MVEMYASDTGWIVSNGSQTWEFESLVKAQAAARVVAKHGNHDQSSHGHRQVALDIGPNGLVSADSKVSATYPHVGLSDRAKTVAAKITDRKLVDESQTFVEGTIPQSTKTYVATYTGPDGRKYELQASESVYPYENAIGKVVDGKVFATFEGQFVGEMKYSSVGRQGAYPYDTHPTAVSRISHIGVYPEFQRQGLATALTEFARTFSETAVLHSTSVTDAGGAFSVAVKAIENQGVIVKFPVGASPFIKHGTHDQSTHGHRGFSADFTEDNSISGYVTYRSKSTNMSIEMEKSITPKRRKEILDAFAEMQDVAPIDDVTVQVVKGRDNGVYGVTVMATGPKRISLNATMLYGPKPDDALFMAHPKVSMARYTVIHEWGHAVAAAQTSDFSRVPAYQKIHAAAKDAADNLGMSKYGMDNYEEFFAEAFADWHLSGGVGTTEATRQMAELGKWDTLSGTVLKSDSALMIVDTFSITNPPTRKILSRDGDEWVGVVDVEKHGNHDQSTHGHRGAGSVSIRSEYGDEVKMVQGTIGGRRTSYGDAHEAPKAGSDFDVNITNIEEHMPDLLGPKGMQLYRTGMPKSDKESLDVLRSLTGDPNQKVTIYRAAPENVTEFNDGNWVSLSPSYAATHVMSRFDGKAHVISAEVPVSSLWTDGNSMNEIGFDRGTSPDVAKEVAVRFPAGVRPTLKHLDGQHDQSSHGHRGAMSLDEAIDFLHTLEIDATDEHTFWRKAFQAVAEKTGRAGKPTVKEFDGTEEDVMFRIFEGGRAFTGETRARDGVPVETKVDTFLNGELPYAAGGRYGFGLYTAPKEYQAKHWTISSESKTSILKLGSSSKLKLAGRDDMRASGEAAPDLINSLKKKNPLWVTTTGWRGRGNLTNLLLFAQGYDGLDMRWATDELVIWSNSKLLVDKASLPDVNKSVAFRIDRSIVDLLKHGNHDQSTHGRRGGVENTLVGGRDFEQLVASEGIDFQDYNSASEAKAKVAADIAKRMKSSTDDLVAAAIPDNGGKHWGYTGSDLLRASRGNFKYDDMVMVGTDGPPLMPPFSTVRRRGLEPEELEHYGKNAFLVLDHKASGGYYFTLQPLMTADRIAKVGTPEADALVREMCASSLVAQWAQSSNGGRTSLGVQRAAKEQFKLGDASDESGYNMSAFESSDVKKFYDQHGAVLRDFVQVQHDATQEFFKKRGVTHVTLFRGTKPIPKTSPKITTYQTRPLSSWAMDKGVAEQFASKYYDGKGVTYVMTVPVSKILSTPLTGNGCLNEYEAVLLGGTFNIDGWMSTQQTKFLKGKANTADDVLFEDDWIKTLRWDLPTQPEAFTQDELLELSQLPAWEAAPSAIKDALLVKGVGVKFPAGVKPVLKHGNHDQSSHGRRGSTQHPALADLPLPIGETPVPDGHRRMYHQTYLSNVDSIRENGLLFDKARGLEGPKGVWLSDKPFYGNSGSNMATVEVALSKEYDIFGEESIVAIGEDISPSKILAIHEPWHNFVRDYVKDPDILQSIMSGEFDDMTFNPDDWYESQVFKAIAHIKANSEDANLVKHLDGQHDQSTHGRRGKGFTHPPMLPEMQEHFALMDEFFARPDDYEESDEEYAHRLEVRARAYDAVETSFSGDPNDEEYLDPDEYLDAMYQRHLQLGREKSLTENPAVQELGKEVQSYVDDADVVVAVSASALVAAVIDGRFKSQFETGFSSGLYDPEMRKVQEAVTHGLPPNLADKERPIYGFLATQKELHGATTEQYGAFRVVANKSVRDRTTFTIGDSLGGNAVSAPLKGASAGRVALAASNERLAAVLTAMPSSAVSFVNRRQYFEAQIQGGLKAADIKRIHITEKDFRASQGQARTARSLAKMGFKVFVDNASGSVPVEEFDVAKAVSIKLPAGVKPVLKRGSVNP